ncbi:nucleotidyltransferase domain-containing protein [Candidatus Poriferisodalis sp.]|uniref:nucleotidyltransferase domain-containing protein n=1 Tax=Candidatus Poriferisodalis sp. TaxID=3101277 RepID=UPI003B01D191
MALRDDALLVPAVEHAQAAAELLAEEGVSVVLLHGSVARGTAREGSDVDLVAVFDDIDYDERYLYRWRLEAKCSAAAGVPVEVHVTDWPEWKHRTEQVPSSYEAAVAAGQQTLFEREPRPGAVRWGKEIGMPDSNLDEALERLAGVQQALASMNAACRQRDDEIQTVDGQAGIVSWVREMRLRDLCADASMTIETALKTMCAANGVASERTHSVAALVQQASPLQVRLEDALAPLQANTLRPSREAYDDVSCWRIGGTYPGALPLGEPEKTEELARLLVAAAVTSADVALRRLLDDGADPHDERFARCQQQMRNAEATLAAADPVTGEPSQ